MRLEHKDIIEADVDQVYDLVKNKLPILADHLPSVEKIVEVDRANLSDNHVKIVNHWFAKAELPGFLNSILNKDIMSWKDIAHWDDNKKEVTYDLESFIANDLFEARGTNKFTSAGKGKTEVHLACEVVLHVEKIPGIPRLLSSKAKPLIEKLLEKMLAPNLTSLGAAIKSYLDSRK